MRKKIIAILCTVAILLGCTLPTSADTTVYFTSLNDNLLPLTANSMPMWWTGDFYAPASILDPTSTGIDLKTTMTHNSRTNELTFRGNGRTLVFQLDDNTSYNPANGLVYDVHALTINGQFYIPIYIVANFLGVNVNVYDTDYGKLLRLTSDSAVLSGQDFIEGADHLMSSRLKEYTQSLAPVTPPVTTEPTPPQQTTSPTYLGVRCDVGTDTTKVRDILLSQKACAVFFLPPDYISQNGDIVRSLIISGQSIGILAEGETIEETRALLAEGLSALADEAFTSTTLVLVPPDQSETLALEGWVTWNETASFLPPEGKSLSLHAATVIANLKQTTLGVRLTLDDGDDASTNLLSVIYQLKGRKFIPSIPLETAL